MLNIQKSLNGVVVEFSIYKNCVEHSIHGYSYSSRFNTIFQLFMTKFVKSD